MVRMSDLVRGIHPQPAHAPAPPPTRLAAGLPQSATAPPPRREPEPAPALDAPAPPPSAIEAPAESAEALYGEIQQFVAGVRDLVNDGSVAFPWAGLERLMARAVASLERSGELFWVANNPAAPPGIDYLAFHQAQVAVLSIRIGADIGYDRRRLVLLDGLIPE